MKNNSSLPNTTSMMGLERYSDFLKAICLSEKITDASGSEIPKIFGLEDLRGCSTVFDDRRVMWVQEGIEGLERLHVMAHEVGHLALGHLKHEIPPKNSSGLQYEEIEATVFSTVLTALFPFQAYGQKEVSA